MRSVAFGKATKQLSFDSQPQQESCRLWQEARDSAFPGTAAAKLVNGAISTKPARVILWSPAFEKDKRGDKNKTPPGEGLPMRSLAFGKAMKQLPF